MFCPKCRAEFRDGFSRCEGCDRDLVEEADLPPEPEKGWIEALLTVDSEPEHESSEDGDDVEPADAARESCPEEAIKVFESPDPFLINAVTDLLDEHQIEFFVQQSEHGPDVPSAIFGKSSQPDFNPVQIRVLPEQEAEVRRLLEDFRPQPEKGELAFADLPPELAGATDESDPESEDGSEYEPEIPASDHADGAEPVFCPHCRAKLELTEEEEEASEFTCPVCGKTIEFEDA